MQNILLVYVGYISDADESKVLCGPICNEIIVRRTSII